MRIYHKGTVDSKSLGIATARVGVHQIPLNTFLENPKLPQSLKETATSENPHPQVNGCATNDPLWKRWWFKLQATRAASE